MVSLVSSVSSSEDIYPVGTRAASGALEAWRSVEQAQTARARSGNAKARAITPESSRRGDRGDPDAHSADRLRRRCGPEPGRRRGSGKPEGHHDPDDRPESDAEPDPAQDRHPGPDRKPGPKRRLLPTSSLMASPSPTSATWGRRSPAPTRAQGPTCG